MNQQDAKNNVEILDRVDGDDLEDIWRDYRCGRNRSINVELVTDYDDDDEN
jgi:hypothetical protein